MAESGRRDLRYQKRGSKEDITMTREQAKKNLIALGIAEPTDEQVSSYLNQHNGEVNEWKEKAAKAGELQTKLDEIEQKNLTELEKEKKARETAENRAADLQKQLTKSAVEGIFAKGGLSGEEFNGMVDALSSLELEAAKTSAESFVSGISKRDEANKTQWQKENFNNTPNPGDGANGGNGGTGEEKSAAAEYAKQYSKQHNPQPNPTPSLTPVVVM